MIGTKSLSCLLVGEGSLLLRCLEILSTRSFRVLAVVSSEAEIDVDFPLFPCLSQAMAALEERPDLLFSIVNPIILSEADLAFPRLAAINYHDSPLPRYAGVNAPSWAIFYGEYRHGVTWHLMAPRVDAGKILVQLEFHIDEDENAFSLSIKCFQYAQQAFVELLNKIEAGQLEGIPQDISRRTLFARSQRLPRQGIIQWTDPAMNICRFVRSGNLGPYPNDYGLPKILFPDGTLAVAVDVEVLGYSDKKPAGQVVDCDGATLTAVAGDGVMLQFRKLTNLDGDPYSVSSGLCGVVLPCLDLPQEAWIDALTSAAALREESVRRALATLPKPFLPSFLRPFGFQAEGEHVIEKPIDESIPFSEMVASVLSRLLEDDCSLPGVIGLYQKAPLAFMSVRPLVCHTAQLEVLTADIQSALAAPPVPADLPFRFSDVRKRWIRLQAISVCFSDELYPPIDNPGLLICVARGKLSLRFAANQIDGGVAADLAAYLSGDSDRSLPVTRNTEHGTPLVHQLIAKRAKHSPDAVAIENGDHILLYHELEKQAVAIASRLLQENGVHRERLYALLLPQGMDFPIAVIGVLKSGAAYLPLDVSAPVHRLRTIIRDAQPLAVITTQAHEHLAKQLCCDVICLDSISFPGCAAFIAEPDARDLAYMIYTSGSSGRPKGCMIEHGAMAHFIDASMRLHSIGPGDRVLQLCAVTFDASVEEIFSTLCAGATLVIRPASLLESAHTFLDFCETSQLTVIGIYPSLLAEIVSELEIRGRFPESVRLVTTGGESVPLGSVERWRTFFTQTQLAPPRLVNVYGLTETTVANLVADLSRPGDLTENVAIGRPIAGTQIRVMNEALQPVAPGEVGELLIGGPQLARSYWNRPEEMARRFFRDPHDGMRWFRTGDLVRVSESGTVYLVGRRDRQVQINGVRLELEEVERIILSHPAVAQAAVLLQTAEAQGSRLVACWVPRSAEDLTPQALRVFLADRLPFHALPSALVPMRSLPLTPNGKLDLRALSLPGLRPEAEIRVPPSTSEQCRLHRLWREVLGHADFGITDNFFLTGGDSLAAARLAASLQGVVNQEVSVKWIFRWPTIEEQAAWVLTLRHPGPTPNLVPLQPVGSRPPLFLVHGLGGSVGGFIELARALAPERPVIGLQASETEKMDPISASVEQMAEGYAEQILAVHQGAPIHLLGYSVGGWYAHAVAAALLNRGAPMGLFAVLDTHPTARIHRRIGLVLLLQRLQFRLLPHLRGLLQPPAGQRRRRYLHERLKAVNQHLHDHLRVRIPVPGRLSGGGKGASALPVVGDAYAQLPWDGYRPPPAPPGGGSVRPGGSPAFPSAPLELLCPERGPLPFSLPRAP